MAQTNSTGTLDVTHGVIWKQLLALCVPIFLSSFFQQAYNLANTFVVGQFGGKLALGGIQSCLVLGDFCTGFALGVGSGCAGIAGRYFGARNYRRMRDSLHSSLVITVLMVGGFSTFLFVCVPFLAGLFIADEAVIASTTLIMRFVCPLYVCHSLMDNVAGVIRDAGESLRPMVLTVLGSCVFRVIWLLAVVPSHHTLEMVLVSYPVTWTLMAVLFVLYYRMGHWLKHAQEHEAAAHAA